MTKIIAHVLANVVALMAMPYFIAGIAVTGFYPALIAALIWGLISVTVRPILGLLTLPINLITLRALFVYPQRAVVLVPGVRLLQGFEVAGFVAGALGLGALGGRRVGTSTRFFRSWHLLMSLP
jgi:putative membrane protein